MTAKESLTKFRQEQGEQYHQQLLEDGYSPEQIAASDKFADAVAEIIDQQLVTKRQGAELFVQYSFCKLLKKIFEKRDAQPDRLSELPHQAASQMVN